MPVPLHSKPTRSHFTPVPNDSYSRQRASPAQPQPRTSHIHGILEIERQLLPHQAPAMARGNQRDKAREANQKKLASQVSPHRVP
ncbi:hypothetical protein FJTKL_00689 [Diaporthe vaccinii]|uniref:Small EDRK-rich factor-like N-terminal domain-containing protein n=1 Tax=Diaporthe vaccinii TaxID=105482 RepID=A0ABR4F674_9PEZI